MTILHFKPSQISVKHFNNTEHLDLNNPLFIIINKYSQNIWDNIPNGEVLHKRFNFLNKDNNNDNIKNLDIFNTQLPNDHGTDICIINLEKYNSSFKILDTFRKQIVKLTNHKPENINLLILDNNNSNNKEELINKFLVCAGSFYTTLPKISQKDDHIQNDKLNLLCHNISETYDHARAIAEITGNGLTRHLCCLPANHLYPETYREYVQELAQEYGWEYNFIDQEELKQKQAGAYLAVVQGSVRKDAGIIKLNYKPKDLASKKIALVGKGMCFDTGGHNLKTPLGSMYGMNHDMTGSAVALGSLLAFTLLQVPFEIEAWLALAENDIGPDAYKPGDVVFASNGMSIEVINTDAEGRMVLADTLYQASLGKPDLVMDYATLTGSCVRALDELYSGLITNKPEWNDRLVAIGQNCGERVWPFPNTDDYDDVLKSDIADIKQCHEGSADQIRAARFLNKFIYEDTPWIHIDLSSHAHKGGLGHINTETTGFGIRYTLSCLLDSDLVFA